MKTEKYIDIEGNYVFFRKIEGEFWISIKRICEALDINYNRAFKNLKKNKILESEYAVQQMIGADNKVRRMICLPEKHIYKWMFSLRSTKSENLQQYKKDYYKIKTIKSRQ